MPLPLSSKGIEFHVLTDRQKFVGLTGYIPGVAYDDVDFTVLTQPTNGVLIGTAPNLCYVPDAGFVGTDSFVYEARAGATVGFQRTVTLNVAANFVPPIGIPEPEFGIAETHYMYENETYDFGSGPEPYRDAGNGPYTHYVDFENGSDVGNDVFGSAANPRRTIPQTIPGIVPAVTYEFPPGSVIEIHGAPFDYRPRITITGNGTAAKPIFVRGVDPRNKPVFRRPFTLRSDYIIVENIEFDCRDFGLGMSGTIWIQVNEQQDPVLRLFNHIAVRHCLFRDQPTTVAGAQPAAVNFRVTKDGSAPNTDSDLLEHLVVYDVEVRNFSQWDDFTGTDDYIGVHFGPNTRYGWVLDSHLHHTRSHGICLSRTNGLSNHTPARDVFLGRNYVHNCKEDPIQSKLGVNIVVSQNTIHTVRDSDSGNGDGIGISNHDANDTWPATDNAWVVFNEIYDAERGIDHTIVTPPGGVPPGGVASRSYIVGNVIHDTRAINGPITQRGAAVNKGQLAQSRIIGNTIYNCDQGIWLGLPNLTEPHLSTAVVRNNLILNLTEAHFDATGQHAMHIFLRPNETIPFTVVDHNLHWEDAGQVRFNIVNPGNTTRNFSDVAAMFLDTGLGAVSLQIDPLLVDPENGDFHLSAGSPCINAGLADDVYTLFPILYPGLSIDFYQDGTPMTPGQFDIGALPVE